MAGEPIGGIWQAPSGGVTPALGNDNNPAFAAGDNGMADFDPNLATIGNNLITYVYEDSDGCQNSAQTSLTVYDIPTIDFTVGNGCVGIPVPFNPTATVPGTVTVVGYVWDYDDDKREAFLTPQTPTNHTYINDWLI